MSKTVQKYFAIHAGHTRVKFGLFDLAGNHCLPECRVATSIENADEFPWSDVGQHLTETTQLVSILTGSNQTKMDHILSNWNKNVAPPISLPDNSVIPVKSLVELPEKVGTDRLLNAVAVNVMRETGRPAIIVDSGTAITVDVLDRDGYFLGGAILPGILMGAKALHEFTTTLPLIDGREFLEQTPDPIGKNTELAMASGLYWGHLGATKELITRMSEEVEGNPQVFVTGGALPILSSYLSKAICNPYLTLLGTVLTADAIKNGR